MSLPPLNYTSGDEPKKKGPSRPIPARPSPPAMPTPSVPARPSRPAPPIAEPKRPVQPLPAPAPAPVYAEPTPAPAPVYAEPTPAPAPVYAEPTPAPAPVYAEPTPAPAPVYAEPTPAPAPVYAEPTPAPAPVYAEPTPIHSSPQQYSDNEEEETGKGGKRKANKSRNKTNKSTNSSHSFMKAVRIGVAVALGMLVVLGVKSVVFPPNIPSIEAIADGVGKKLGISGFPETRGAAIATGFYSAYYTLDPNNTGARAALLEQYNYKSNGADSYGSQDAKVTITEGPYVFKVKSLSNVQSVYTVGAKINGASWRYASINVLYKESTDEFVVPSAPNITTGPMFTEISEASKVVNEEMTPAAKPTIDAFFKSWVASDNEGIAIYLSESANPAAKQGLQGVYEFVEVPKFEIYTSEEATGNSHAARAWVQIRDKASEGLTIVSEYDLLLESKDGKWFVVDLKAHEFSPEIPTQK